MSSERSHAVRWLAERAPTFAKTVATGVTERVRSLLEESLPNLGEVRHELDELLPAADRLADDLTAALYRLDTGPFRGEMTVHAAHARHPGARAIFARRGLPGCPDCAVGRDETLAEAALGEGFALAELIAELQALESGCTR